MKKSLGIVAVALIVGAPALAQNTSTMSYTLMQGGSPSLNSGAPYNLAGAVEGPVSYPNGTTVVNWAARVSVAGDLNGAPVGGAANIVFDLKLHAGDSIAAPLVGPAFGIGGPAAAGFFSVVQNNPAGGFDGQQPAAFPWVFDADWMNKTAPPYGRLFDEVSANGPAMRQYTYPSTFNYYRKIVGGVSDSTANTTTVTAASGTLMGMGAGYSDFDFFDGTDERGGVGLPTDVGGLMCYQAIGNEPIAEGQINVTGLPGGTYTLELVAGTGNNVILPTISCDPGIGGSGGGAFAAAAGTVTGSTIQFTLNNIVVSPPVMSGAKSWKQHGVSSPLFFGLPLDITAGDRATSEPRNGGVSQLVVTYNKAIGGTPVVTVTATGGAAPVVGSTSMTGTDLTINLTGGVDKTCVSISISGVADAANPTAIAPTHVVKVTNRIGDVTGATIGVADGQVQVNDVNLIRSKVRIGNVNATDFMFDLNLGKTIEVGDVNLVRSKVAIGTTGCTN